MNTFVHHSGQKYIKNNITVFGEYKEFNSVLQGVHRKPEKITLTIYFIDSNKLILGTI